MPTSPSQRFSILLAAAVLVAACGDPRRDFIGARAPDRCDSQWPVCEKIAGCILGETSYSEGHFPGSGRFIVQLFEPSTVRVTMLVENLSARGDLTVFNFFEDRCRARIREELTGEAFAGEVESVGFITREADLFGLGDHLIEFQSDSKANYLLKVDIIPKRLQP
jgi:hypothetical protein